MKDVMTLVNGAPRNEALTVVFADRNAAPALRGMRELVYPVNRPIALAVNPLFRALDEAVDEELGP